MIAGWKKLLENPALMRRAQGWLTVFWFAMIPTALVLGWVKSVTFVSALSLWALVASHGAWWAAASVECRQAAENVPEDVVEKLVDETSVESAS